VLSGGTDNPIEAANERKEEAIALGVLLLAVVAAAVWLATTDRKKLARSVKLETGISGRLARRRADARARSARRTAAIMMGTL
jgi:hypothetical protein